MIDRQKRQTLKLAATGVASTLLPATTRAYTGNTPAVEAGNSLGSIDDASLAQLYVDTRLNPATNDIEVAITNAGSERTVVTGITPATLSTARGEFQFSRLLGNGPVGLEPGEAMFVPLNHASRANVAGSSLRNLPERMSIVTDGNAFAAVQYEGSLKAVV